ncbi:lysine--tRNA ligase [Candidatus Micrarchaeota archaeon]|nr:lysine--tRNA ligase [Candidatus Micrarchaeota archaeon]
MKCKVKGVVKQPMFWADSIAKEAPLSNGAKKHVVGDGKTPSGRIHVGSLRGVVTHDAIYRALLDAGKEAEFVYRFDDYDALDAVPAYLPPEYCEHLGKPLSEIPSPEPGFRSYGAFFALEFQSAFEKLGCHPRVEWASEDYKGGKMNAVLKEAMEKAEIIREINARVSAAKKADGWLPIHAVCEKCGRISTTQSRNFDGETVEYACTSARYVKGCGHAGRRSPFNGGAKLTWKAHWAAQFKVYGITIEGEGKDLATVGGARDATNEVCRKVFNYEPPYDLPYEFFLVGGKKMSTSKGTGMSAREIAEFLSPEVLRFLLARYKPRTAINFSPEGETVPKLYDDFDSFAEAHFRRREPRDPDEPRIYELSSVRHAKPGDFLKPPFPLVAYLIQVPHIDVVKVFNDRKGTPLTLEELACLQERVRVARLWLEKFAGEEFKFRLIEHAEAIKKFHSLPAGAQRALHEFSEFFAQTNDEAAQANKIREVCEKHGISVQDFYKAAYAITIGKEKGPKLLPFISSLERPFVVQRFMGVV